LPRESKKKGEISSAWQSEKGGVYILPLEKWTMQKGGGKGRPESRPTCKSRESLSWPKSEKHRVPNTERGGRKLG